MANPHNNTIGEKIRMYRKRSGMSQLDLELEIDASPGFISRIESGKVNPTKETIAKLTNVFDLSEAEISDIYNVSLDKYIERFLDINQYYLKQYIVEQRVSQTNFQEMMNGLNINIAGIVLLNGNKLELDTTILPKWCRKLAEQDMGWRMEDIKFELDNPQDDLGQVNLCFKKQEVIVYPGIDFIGKPLLGKNTIKLINRTLKIKNVITIPLTFDNVRVGVLAFVWNYDSFNNLDSVIFSGYAKQLAYGIYASQRFLELEKEIMFLKEK